MDVSFKPLIQLISWCVLVVCRDTTVPTSAPSENEERGAGKCGRGIICLFWYVVSGRNKTVNICSNIYFNDLIAGL